MTSLSKRLRQAIHFLSEDVTETEEKTLYDKKVKTALTDVLQVSHKHGLSPDDITQVVSLICKRKFSEKSKLNLARSLLPKTVVPSHAILRIISWIGTRNSSHRFNVFLFGWIVAVFDHIDDLRDVRCAYEIILQYLHHDVLRRYACMLLALLTRKNDVKLYRVQRILRIKSPLGNDDPHLNSLLRVYKLFRPDLVKVEVPLSKPPHLPKSMNLVWTDQIATIQGWEFSAARKEAQMFFSSEKKDYWNAQNCSLNMSNTQLPQQSFFVNADLQRVISCIKDGDYLGRFNCNIHNTLMTGYIYPGKSSNLEGLEELLEKTIDFSQYLQEGIPILKSFLIKYLNDVWNGSDITSSIFMIVQRLRLCSVEDLKFILQPIEKHYILSNVNFKVVVLQSLTELVRNFVSVEWKRFSTAQNKGDQVRPWQFVYLFDDDDDGDISPAETVEFLINFVDRLCNIGLVLENGNSFLLHIVLSFYDTVADASLVHGLKCGCVPSTGVIYYSLFTFNTAALSRMCSLLVKCSKVAVANKVSLETLTIKTQYRIKHLNRYILDLSNCLWRRQPFADQEKLPSIFDIKDKNDTTGETIVSRVRLKGETFNLLYHPALISLAKKFRNQAHINHDPRAILKRSEVYQFLEFISANGFPGILEFARTFTKTPERSGAMSTSK